MVDFDAGRMGVAAVPGSGKTQTLSYLAARLIREQKVDLSRGQEVLVVTLTNSAVGNFESRISRFIEGFGLMPRMGFRVRTLHGLAHDIVRERPDLVGLPTQFNIIDDRESELMLQASVRDFLLMKPSLQETYFSSTVRMTTDRAKDWNDLAVESCRNFIRTAKDLQLEADDVRGLVGEMRFSHPLVTLGMAVYSDYARKLALREGVDFDDLIRYALAALQTDPAYLARLRARWPFVLEDEAQDSSHLQQQILALISGEGGNWVRVGDPNQAIYETFTTADPRLLRDFIQQPGVQRADLPNSGRSTASIIRLANRLVEWTVHEHPIPVLRDALFETYIEPTPPGDPQPNPPDDESRIRIVNPTKRVKSEGEIQFTLEAIQQWMANEDYQNQSLAVLVPTNRHGESMIKALREHDIPYVELLRNTTETRQTAAQIEAILYALANPDQPRLLRKAYGALRLPRQVQDPAERAVVKRAADLLLKCANLEEYLYPRGGADWLMDRAAEEDPQVVEELAWLRERVVRWQEAVRLPVDQLILTIAGDLYTQPVDLALSHKFAQMLEYYARNHREWSLPEYAAQLHDIASARRGFSGLSENDIGFDPDDHRGEVTVATIHKAKGLEWDIVYLLSVNNYDFPSLDPFDSYVSEKWFIRDELNLQEEMLSKLKALAARDMELLELPEGAATIAAREGIAEERLRLLYVGITRARKQLNLLWNVGLREKCQPARALQELYAWWKEHHDDRE